jgi:CheY-like chemotaxis protein
MCGITGIFETRERKEISRDVLARMNETQRHRGPDEGSYHVEPGVGLGHRRLSIIDLSQLGHQPILATSVDDALQAVRRQSFDLIISDYRMPQATGLDLLELLREQGCDSPVIIMTGYASIEHAVLSVRHAVRSSGPIWEINLLPSRCPYRSLTRLKSSISIMTNANSLPVRTFLRNSYFTPTLQTALVLALESMGNIAGREQMIVFAARAASDEPVSDAAEVAGGHRVAGGGRGLGAVQEQVPLVLNDPFDDLALLEFHGLGEGGGEIDVPLLAGLAVDQLDAGGRAHGWLLSLSSYITRHPGRGSQAK